MYVCSLTPASLLIKFSSAYEELQVAMLICTSYHMATRALVWLARPSHLIAGALRAGRDGLAAVTISSHLFDQSDATGRNSC